MAKLTYIIEDNIPLATTRFDRSSKEYQTLLSMKIGQSFIVPISKQNLINSCKVYLWKENQRQFVKRKLNKDEVRIWRVADNSPRMPGRKRPPGTK